MTLGQIDHTLGMATCFHLYVPEPAVTVPACPANLICYMENKA